ncbi:hypothetical protein HK100_004593, partial [Physocladia obscura]
KASQTQVAYALKWLIPTLIFSGGIIGVMYWQLGYAEIPVQQLVGTLKTGFSLTVEYCALTSASAATCSSTPGYRYPQVSWIVYTVAIIALIGWAAFAIFGGAGLVALPVDLIQDFQHRPKPITADQYALRKKQIGERATELLEVGKDLQQQLREAARGGVRANRRFRQLRLKENDFRKDSLILDFHYHQMELAYNHQSQNILIQYAGFIGGCLRMNETMMNSMLFNVGVILVSSLAVSQFCALAFARYAKYTAAGYLFGVQLQKLKNMQYVYIGFICGFAAVAAIMIGWIIYKPRSKREKRFDMKW